MRKGILCFDYCPDKNLMGKSSSCAPQKPQAWWNWGEGCWGHGDYQSWGGGLQGLASVRAPLLALWSLSVGTWVVTRSAWHDGGGGGEGAAKGQMRTAVPHLLRLLGGGSRPGLRSGPLVGPPWLTPIFPTPVTGGYDPLIRLWNPFFLKKPVWLMRGHQTSVTHILVNSKNSNILLSVSKDKVLASGSTALTLTPVPVPRRDTGPGKTI